MNSDTKNTIDTKPICVPPDAGKQAGACFLFWAVSDINNILSFRILE